MVRRSLQHDAFRPSFARARAEGEEQLIEDGLYDPDTDSSMAKFLLKTSFKYVETERHEHRVDEDADLAEGWHYVAE